MAGHKNFRVLEEKMGAARVKKARAKARDMMGEMVLAELRRHADFTQAELAKALGVSQPAVSAMEQQGDMQISTLKRVIAALGGEMQISVKLKGETYHLGGVS